MFHLQNRRGHTRKGKYRRTGTGVESELLGRWPIELPKIG
jgi:hypothetical protein